MPLTSSLKRAVKRMPGIRNIIAERDALYERKVQLEGQLRRITPELEAFRHAHRFAPPGHFYSPMPEIEGIRNRDAAIFDRLPNALGGMELNEAAQLALLATLQPYYDSLPFTAQRSSETRYYFDNPAYSYSDGILLHCMIRHLKPRRIVEVGSGFSSCLMLDTVEMFLEDAVDLTFIEPYPEVLLSLIRDEDIARVKLVRSPVQEVDRTVFDQLERNDILFIDSSHVSKINSDVNHLVFEVLPFLKPGVYVHIHDIFHPFECPRDWVYTGRAWNEAYLLCAFLQFNKAFSVVLMNTYMERFHQDFFAADMPLCLKDPGGSIWLRRD